MVDGGLKISMMVVTKGEIIVLSFVTITLVVLVLFSHVEFYERHLENFVFSFFFLRLKGRTTNNL